MAKFWLELHKSGEKVFIGANTSNPEWQKHIWKQVISVNGSDNSIDSIIHAFQEVNNNSRNIHILLGWGTSIDILPQWICQRFQNWFNWLSTGTYPLPAIDDPYIKTGLWVNPKTGKIRITQALVHQLCEEYLIYNKKSPSLYVGIKRFL